MDGILLVDKPGNLTSHDVVSRLRHALHFSRIGHAGTLDPDATGLLVLCLGKATKVSSILAESDKTYRVKFVLGCESDTYDSTGKILKTRPVAVEPERLSTMLKAFQGTQEQKPPIYSAIKVDGKKLYEYARAGEEVEVPIRTVTIYSIVLLSFESPDVEMDVTCSKGTYIRSLVHDIGQKLGTGAMTTEIRRTRSGTLRIENARKLDEIVSASDPVQIANSALIPIPRALSGLPRLKVPPRVLARVLQGAALRSVELSACRWEAPAPGAIEPVLVVGDTGQAVALGSYDGSSTLRVRRVL